MNFAKIQSKKGKKMKKMCVLAAFVLSLFGADTSWMNKWKGTSDEPKATEPKTTQSISVKSVGYYRQNPSEAWDMLAVCEDMAFAEMDGDAQEKKRVADFYKTKDGKIFKQNCDNASESVR